MGSTSAYFSDTNSGGYVAASLGSIKVSVDGDKGSTPVIDFGSMLPGEEREGGFIVANIGRSAQDVYITYPNEMQLKVTNQMGTYAEIGSPSTASASSSPTTSTTATRATRVSPRCQPS